MKRYIILFGALLAVAAMGYAYDGVARLFTDESGELFNSLSLSARYELLNNFSKGETVEVVNNLRTTESRITQLTSDHMVVATSSARTVEMKLLPRAKGDTVLAVIETVATPVKDSRLTFYDMKWNPLEASKFIKMPEAADFFLPSVNKEKRDEMLSMLNFAMIEMAFDGDNLVARCNLEDFFLGDDFKFYKPLVTNRIVYTVKKAKFKRQ